MAGKFEMIIDLYQQAVKELTKSQENWISFLQSACRNYRLPFDEQLLIHVQRPDATAVLQIEHWNKRFGRWVKKGSKGIAVLDKSAGQMGIKYYFDISDTQESRQQSLIRPVPLWEVREEHWEEVKETLSNSFSTGDLERLDSIIMLASHHIAEENMPDYLPDILAGRENSRLEGLDEQNIRLKVRTILENSIAFMIMTRCGCDIPEYFLEDDFSDILDFNTPELVNLLGTAVSDMGQIPLREIADTIQKHMQYEKKRYHTFAFSSGGRYSVAIENQKGGSNNDRNHIQQIRGLPPAEPDRTRRTESRWEIRITPKEVSDGEPLREISEPFDAGRTEQAFVTDSGGSQGTDGRNHRADGTEAERDRKTQGRESDGVGREDEQHPAGSGGNRVERTDLQLKSEERQETEKSGGEDLPDFPVSMLEDVLCFDEYMNHKRFDIQLFFQEHENEQERIGYVKESYQAEHSLFDVNGQRVGYKAEENHLLIWEGNDLTRTSESRFSWREVQERIAEMIGRGVYYNRNPFGKLPTENQQLSLLDIGFDLQSESMTTSVPQPAVKQFTLSQQVIDEALCTGGNKPDSVRRICANYMHNRTPEENIAFLQEEYGTDGKGFISSQGKMAVWYQEDGIHLARGDSALNTRNSLVVSWEQADRRILELLQQGRYAPQEILEEALPAERQELAEKLCYLHRDISEGVSLLEELFSRDFPKDSKQIAEAFKDSEKLEQIIRELEEFALAYEEDPALMRFHYYKPRKLLQRLKVLQREPVVFQAQGEFSEPQLFISQDEIDALFMNRGSGFEHGKYRIYSYFLHDHSEKEQIAFLKAEYGTGGAGWAGYNEDHDSKGIVFSRGELMKPYDKVTISWKQAVSRIKRLMREERYLSEKEIAHIPEYERGVLAGEIYNFYYNQPKEVMCPYPYGAHYHDAIETIYPQLEQTEWVDGILDSMGQVLDNTAEFDRHYESMQKTYHDLQDYREGKYTLFPNLSQNAARILAGSRAEHKVDGRAEKVPPHSDGLEKEEEKKNGVLDEELEEEQPDTEEPPAEKEDLADYIPAWERKLPKATLEDLHPGVPQAERNQYRITDDALGQGTPKEKFRANTAAIQLLKKCESEGRFATADEQEILAKYVGWGGLSDAFDETKAAWGTEYLDLKTVLTEEEYAAARASTLTAFYTPPVVIRTIYQALENMGLRSGNLLEPSCGVGNFIGMKPESLSDCKMYGVELDSISARIAAQLYQKSRIAGRGYEETGLPDSFFDVAVGNVPFGQFKVSDKRYDKYNFLIHDYFFAKTLDKVRPGGIIAFITSSGTMDKKNLSVRKYIAERAELLGAIRLPNDTFQKNAGTKVTSDILFLQKREYVTVQEPDWMYLDTDENGIPVNHYFAEHPEMILGEMVMETSQFGMDSTCRPRQGVSLESQLQEAIQNIKGEITDYEPEELVEEDDQSIPADPEVVNFSYTVTEGRIYYRENSRMKPVELSVTGQNRVRGMIAIRDSVRKLIEYQTEGYPESDIKKEQENLNRLYDTFQKKYGLLNSRGNNMVFSEDNSYPLLCSLEILKEDGTLERKADMFHKRTIKPDVTVNRVDTAGEALAVSLAERAKVDMERMQQLCGKSREEIETELTGVIYRLPGAGENPVFVTADEYLSGNVREKLKTAKMACEVSEVYRTNVEALEKVIPEDLSAAEIKVRLGTTWIPAGDFQDFMFDLLQTSEYHKRFIKVQYSEITSQWSVQGKNQDKENVKANSTYGTERASAYRIMEDSLNLRDIRIYDYIWDEEGKKKAVLNKKETAVAQGKQEVIRQAFDEWIWKDPGRRERLVRKYNDTFNAIRPREYDGSHLTFPGMNPEISLRKHQINAIARTIYGGNTLLAHVVGAGKTYTMVAAAMKMKQMGLCHKSMVVVPNHIIEQFAAEWLQLYPSANILVATKKSFEKKNRKKFCARIATGDYDAVIIGHSQYEKIPISTERQRIVLEQQKAEVLAGIQEVKGMEGGRFTVKQLERTKKSLDLKLEKLNNQERKDDLITFEQLGIDRLFVDEADSYKNLFLYTKMRNVGGIAQTDAQKSSDMFMKCRYIDELTGGKGIIFATGTPVSNSMVELYTMQRYLQYALLEKYHLLHFDEWASMFGETVNAIELAPEGTGYRLKTRFARFHNIPEMMKMFKEVADIQTEDMLNLPVPEANYRVVAVKPSEIQKDMVLQLADRAEQVRSGMVNPKRDNMLKITNDGRKLALDQRLINELLPDDPESKVNACVKEIMSFWEQGKDKKLTQLVFSDLSTPKADGSFNVYDDLRKKLEQAGIPHDEIVFIHEADTDAKKKALFAKVRKGSVRVLIGSTFKMGAGTNVQDRIIASHDLDVPWRPRDLEQRRGRSIRQGNRNKEVDIIRYVTEGTFDAYMYQMIENKQKFISQVMTSKSPARSIEDVDMTALSYAEIKALASGNPAIKEKMDLDVEVSKLQLLKQNFLSQKYELENKILNSYPKEIKEMVTRILCYEQDIAREKENTPALRDHFPAMQIQGETYTEKKEAGKALVEACQSMKSPDEIPIGSYRGFMLGLFFNSFSKEYVLTLKGSQCYTVTLGSDIFGNITRIDNAIAGLPDKKERCRMKLENVKIQYENAKKEVRKTFSREEELREKAARLEELNTMLNMEDTPLMEAEQETGEPEKKKETKKGIER